MMLELLETGKALYALAAVCVLGIVSRLVARNLYKRLIRETDNMALTKNRYLRELKQKAENTYRLNQGLHNTKVYLEKQLANYRFLGLSLNGWGNLSGQLTVLCFFLGGAAAFGAYWYRCDGYYIALYGSIGVLAGLLTLVMDYGVNLGERRNQLVNALQDYMENSLFNRLARETASAMEANVCEVSRDNRSEKGSRNLNVRNVIARQAVGRDGGLRDAARKDGGYHDAARQDGEYCDMRRKDAEYRDAARKDAEHRGVGNKDAEYRGTGRKEAEYRSAGIRDDDLRSAGLRDIESGDEEYRDSERKARVHRVFGARQSDADDDMTKESISQHRRSGKGGRSGVQGAEPIRDVDYLRRSLEQIAASREKNSGEGDWIKELSPKELELVGEILKQYLT